MHTIIGAVVPAEDEDDAVTQAESVFERLTENRDPFDRYELSTHEGTKVSGRGRWSDVTPVAEVHSDEGEELVEKLWSDTADDLKRNLENIQEYFEETDNPEELIEETHEDLIRHKMFNAGQYQGPTIRLYTEYGEGIQTRKQLERRLEDDEESELSVFIVPADVHF